MVFDSTQRRVRRKQIISLLSILENEVRLLQKNIVLLKQEYNDLEILENIPETKDILERDNNIGGDIQ